MFSIIICSINPNFLSQITENIEKTIGVEYEIISYDNTLSNWGICKTYNHCAKKAKFEYLVFCHEDILFHTQNWGQELIKLFQINKVGLVGVSGATYKSQYPTSWAAVPKQYYRTNAIQWPKNGKKFNSKCNPDVADYSAVRIIDGLFMATTKSIFVENQFDETHLTGFHLYDLDYSLKIGKNYNILVSHHILVEHFSNGTLDKKWFKESILWHQIHKNLLPAFVGEFSKQEIRNIKIESLKSVILSCYSTNYHLILMLKSLFSLLFLKPFSKEAFLFFRYTIAYLLGIPKIKKLLRKAFFNKS
jgi:hypothetical protein